MKLSDMTDILSLRTTLLATGAAALMIGGSALVASNANAECIDGLPTGASTHAECTGIDLQTGEDEAPEGPAPVELTTAPLPPEETAPPEFNSASGIEESAEGPVATELTTETSVAMLYGPASDRSPALPQQEQSDN